MHLLEQVAQPQGQSIAPYSPAQGSFVLMSCSVCSALLSPGDATCPGCGLPLTTLTPAPAPARRSRFFWLAAFVVPTLLALFLAGQLSAGSSFGSRGRLMACRAEEHGQERPHLAALRKSELWTSGESVEGVFLSLRICGQLALQRLERCFRHEHAAGVDLAEGRLVVWRVWILARVFGYLRARLATAEHHDDVLVGIKEGDIILATDPHGGRPAELLEFKRAHLSDFNVSHEPRRLFLPRCQLVGVLDCHPFTATPSSNCTEGEEEAGCTPPGPFVTRWMPNGGYTHGPRSPLSVKASPQNCAVHIALWRRAGLQPWSRTARRAVTRM